MCLGIPGQIVAIESGRYATIDSWGIFQRVDLDEVREPVAVGDYIISHAGKAIRRIADQDVMDTLAMYLTVMPESSDVRGCTCVEAEELALV